MRLLADRAVRHRARLEPAGNGFDRLDFVQGNRLVGKLQFHQAAQGGESFRLVVDQRTVGLEHLVILAAAGFLQQVNRPGVEQVQFAVFAVLVLSVHLKGVTVHRDTRKSPGVLLQRFRRDLLQANAAYP